MTELKFDRDYETAERNRIFKAAYEGNLAHLSALLEENPSLLEATDELMWACSHGNVAIVDKLLALGANVNVTDDSDWTPLMIAVSSGHNEVVRKLLVKGALVNEHNVNGQTALHYAASKSRIEVRNGDPSEFFILSYICWKALNMLLEMNSHIDVQDNLKQTPLHRASVKGNAHIVDILLQHGASVMRQDSSGNTALHLAVEEGYVDIAMKLVEADANLEITNSDGKRPLELADKETKHILERRLQG